MWVANEDEARREEKPISCTHIVSNTETWDLQSRFLSWPKLLRVTAFVMRFINAKRTTHPIAFDRSDPASVAFPFCLQAKEIEYAKHYWLRRMQQDAFGAELDSLYRGKPVVSFSPISSLHPFLDSNGLIRVGGKLGNAPLTDGGKHPVLLKAHSLLTQVIEHHHLRTLHAGPELTLASLRNEYWILRARAVVRAVLHRCVKCARARAELPAELMGHLPQVRVTRSERAFTHTGIDYAGPIAIRTTRGRGCKSHKAYIALFICMTIKAVHIELVNDYSTAAFLAAYVRFSARRGIPRAIYSDNGTNFQGAKRELRAAHQKALRNPDFLNQLTTVGVQWHFMPPSAPHFGGLWEAGVKSIKRHLKCCIGAQTLTYEEINTFLCRVESCLNSRPLTAVSESLDDYRPITLGHVLIGTSLFSLPELSLLSLQENRLSRWQLVQKAAEDFWRAWSSDYISTLQQRPKWRVATRLAQVGRLVLLRNAHPPPIHWELDRISACHPGNDELTRVVIVTTSRSSYVRPITKFCFLLVAEQDQVETGLAAT
ncbi:uncharacterized protein LOC112589053 [Harpegnathos saltator]|uniref:uncharacterized protein LOC112589053 n=1 Tax=Harpegnathos saltator TaxID=610380 RepID=UPI000DBED76B|nr:uncharacterized protein LOC112589053 [Harpegnathos saltator]